MQRCVRPRLARESSELKVALGIPKQSLRWSLGETLSGIEAIVASAAAEKPDLLLLPELAATPGNNTDCPEHDLPLGQTVPGQVTNRLGRASQVHGIRFGIGMLERDRDSLYDSAVLFGPKGDIELRYRRIQPQWHGRKADPNVYRQGDEIPVVSTSQGRLCLAICGDLFDEAIGTRIRNSAPDYVLWPIARNFADGSFSQERWDREEESEYIAAAARTGATTFMVNRLVDPASSKYPAFGGALVISQTGEVLARWPLGKPGILYTEMGDGEEVRSA
jgi:nitrilase